MGKYISFKKIGEEICNIMHHFNRLEVWTPLQSYKTDIPVASRFMVDMFKLNTECNRTQNKIDLHVLYITCILQGQGHISEGDFEHIKKK